MVSAAVFLSGCGLAAAPQPPSLKLPDPVKNLTATRTGNQVSLHWTMPKHTTDKVELKGDQRVHICRKVDSGACQTAGDVLAPPDKKADFTDTLPSELTSGSPKLMTYTIELQNHARKTAGPSNPVQLATGAAPAAVTGLSAEVRVDGVVLRWEKAQADSDTVLRIHRTLITKPGGITKPGEITKPGGVSKPAGPKPSQMGGTPPPEEETLEVDLSKGDPGLALDRGAELDHSWRYTAERVEKLTLGKQFVETAGLANAAITVETKDVFPPRAPEGLQSIADAQGHAIDLSWSPNTELDLAGYVVYRRTLAGGMQPEQTSLEKHSVAAPAFHDSEVQPGMRYAYSVSAVDKDGNESARSPEVQEGLPQ
jgi:hypothetical protein